MLIFFKDSIVYTSAKLLAFYKINYECTAIRMEQQVSCLTHSPTSHAMHTNPLLSVQDNNLVLA